jgi:hypothetical protein
MKQINLPITRRFRTRLIDLIKESASGGRINSLGTLDCSVGSKEMDQARMNGGDILWSTICLEQKLESIITEFLFPTLKGARPIKGRDFFSERIVRSDYLSYSVKRKLVKEIVNAESLLEGQDKQELDNMLAKVMRYRNAFAHGDIEFQADTGCILIYSQDGLKKVPLDDQYWTTIEECFKQADYLVSSVLDKLRDLREHK